MPGSAGQNGGAHRRHALTVDVEDWYHDSQLERPAADGRVEANTERLLALFAQCGARATFFFLGEVAHSSPALVRRVCEAGHEVGSHGYRHRHVAELTRGEFREDVLRSVRTIEDAAGVRVRGYRAPYFSIKAGVRWPIEILTECGLIYDASILPFDRPPGLELVCPRRPFRLPSGLWEIPVAVLQVGPFWHLPLASGTGLRILPPRMLERFIRRFERDIGAAVFYLHPWELDPLSPTAPGPGRWLLRIGRDKLPDRLVQLLRGRRFAPVLEAFAETLGERTPDGSDRADG
jgi:polysaccharide deacetylase family protein (PEP-CTERM system associated)